MDSVFIFQSPAEETTATSYDAIVVEQWTVLDVSGPLPRPPYMSVSLKSPPLSSITE